MTTLKSWLRPTTSVGRARQVVIVVALAAMLVKLAIAARTYGSNDVGFWTAFAKGIRDFGPVEIYGRKLATLPYNHAPLSGWMLAAINVLTDHTVLPLRFLIKLPAIFADVVTAIALFEIVRRERTLRGAAWTGVALSLSPVLLVISGYHGNTDPVFVMFAMLSVYFLIARTAGTGATVLAGLAGVSYALSLSIKIVPVVLLPVLTLMAVRAGRARFVAFVVGFGAIMGLLWGPVALANWTAYRQNVLEYGGIDRRQWGIVQFLHWLHVPESFVTTLVGPGRFVVVAIAALLPLVLAWRLPEYHTKAAGLSLVFFLLLSTASATQYLAWTAAAALLVNFWSGLLYNLTAGAFLVYAYDRWSGGVPPWRWYAANVTDWTPFEVRFAAVVWIALLVVAIVGVLPSRLTPQAAGTVRHRAGRAGYDPAHGTPSPSHTPLPVQEDDLVSQAPVMNASPEGGGVGAPTRTARASASWWSRTTPRRRWPRRSTGSRWTSGPASPR